MTREKAIKILTLFREEWDRHSKTPNAKALDMAIAALREPEPIHFTIRWTRPHADSTLARMTKAELIEYVRMCEKNVEAAMQTVDQQAKNVEKLLKESERKKGQWTDFDYDNSYYCTACGEIWTLNDGNPQENNMNFCPNCGADMRGEEE